MVLLKLFLESGMPSLLPDARLLLFETFQWVVWTASPPHSPTGTSTAHGAPDAGDAFSGTPSSPPYSMKPLMVSSFSVTHLAPRDSDAHLPHHCAHCSALLPLLSHCHCSS